MPRNRIPTTIGTAVMVAVALSACSSSDGQAGAAGHATITYMLPTSWANVPGFQDNVHLWEKQTGNTVNLTPVPDANYDSLVQARLAAKSGVDIFAGQDTVKDKASIMRSATGPWIQRLNPAVRKAITSPDGAIWGTPSADGLAAQGVIYNKDVFAKAGINAPPTNLAELAADLQKVKATKVTPLCLSGKDGWTLLQHRNALNANFVGADPQLVSKLDANQTKWTDIPGFTQENQALADWVSNGLTNSDALTATFDSAIAAIANGKCGAIINGTWVFAAITKSNPSANVGFFLLPSANGTSTLGLGKPNLLKVAAFSKVGQQAQDFLNFMIAKPQAQKFMDANPGVSAFTDVKAANPSSSVTDLQKLVDKGGFVVPFDQQSVIPQPQDDIVAAYQELIGKRIDVAKFGELVQKAWQSAGTKARASGF